MKKSFKIVLAILICAVVAVFCAGAIILVISLKEPENQLKFAEFIEKLGFFGILTMLFLQILQIVVAVIPGEPIELMMGLMYGTFGGLFLTLLGILIGTMLVYFFVKRFGEPFAKKFIDLKSFEKFKFLKDPSKRDLFVFILFLIPGTPKDILTYFVPFTDMKLSHFLPLATVARIPSVITSTIVGNSVGEGNLKKSIFVFAITAIIGLVGIFIDKMFRKRLQNNHNSKQISRNSINENHLE